MKAVWPGGAHGQCLCDACLLVSLYWRNRKEPFAAVRGCEAAQLTSLAADGAAACFSSSVLPSARMLIARRADAQVRRLLVKRRYMIQNPTLISGAPSRGRWLADDLGARTSSDTFAADNTVENLSAYLAFISTLRSDGIADPPHLFNCGSRRSCAGSPASCR